MMYISNYHTKLISFFVLTWNLCCSKELLTVQTKLGKIIGRLETYNNKEYSSFYGIRYAKPPVGNLRFSPPGYTFLSFCFW